MMKDVLRGRRRTGSVMTLLVTAIVALTSAPMLAHAQTPKDWHVRTTPRPVAVVVQRLAATIKKGGGSVVVIVDHAAGARKVGMQLPETTVIVFGNPKLGTPLMAQNRAIAIDLPQRVLVWRDGAITKIGYTPPAAIAARYGIAGNDPSVIKMGKALAALVETASKP